MQRWMVMGMREKLVELIEKTGMVENKNRCNIIAEELIANGTTIPVRRGECWAYNQPDCPMSGSPGKVSVSDFRSYGERRTDNE